MLSRGMPEDVKTGRWQFRFNTVVDGCRESMACATHTPGHIIPQMRMPLYGRRETVSLQCPVTNCIQTKRNRTELLLLLQHCKWFVPVSAPFRPSHSTVNKETVALGTHYSWHPRSVRMSACTSLSICVQRYQAWRKQKLQAPCLTGKLSSHRANAMGKRLTMGYA